MREYLKKLREEAHMTQQNVADRLGTTQQYYALIESGERQRQIQLKVLKQLSEIFDKDLCTLIAMEESKKNC